MLICESCGINPICKIFDQKKEFSSIASLSVEDCKYYIGKNYDFESCIAHDLKTLEKRIEEIKSATTDRELKIKKISKVHFCKTCLGIQNDCVRCDDCGNWVCPTCATTTLDGKTLCQECYNEETADKGIDFDG